MSGGCLLLMGEYRGSSLEKRSFTDRKNGGAGAREYYDLKHNLEVCDLDGNTRPIVVREFVEDGKTPEALPFKKGAFCVGFPVGVVQEKGATLVSCRARLQEVGA